MTRCSTSRWNSPRVSPWIWGDGAVSTTAERREEAVRWYHDLGLKTFPYDERGIPFRSWPNPTLAMMERSCSHWVPIYGVALDGFIVVIDIDWNRGGRLEDLEAAFGPLPPTASVRTPSSEQNLHLFFKVTGSTPTRTSKQLKKKFPHIDFLGLGSHVKGATSWVRRDTDEDRQYLAVTYNLQHPVLDVAALPPALEAAWRDNMVTSDAELRQEDLAEAEQTIPKVTLTDSQKRCVRTRINNSLKEIQAARDTERWETNSLPILSIYRNAALLYGCTSKVDDRIVQAYRESGGTDLRQLRSMMSATKVTAAKWPMPAPLVTVRKLTANETIAEWAEAATASVSLRNKQKRALIAAIAAEAKTNLEMTEAAESLAAKYRLGNVNNVQDHIRQLAKDGWLRKTGEGYTLEGHTVNHYRLSLEDS